MHVVKIILSIPFIPTVLRLQLFNCHQNQSHDFGLMFDYNPPLSSDYRVESFTLINAVQNHLDDVLKHIGRCPSDQTVFAVLGDFNLANVCWSSYYASSEYSMNILSAFDYPNLFQLEIFVTILSDKYVDLFWSNDPQRFVVYRSEKTYSDHDPLFAHLNVSGDNCFTPDVSKQFYSLQTLKIISSPLLIFLLEPHLMTPALKRVKEDYSSHSSHLANKLRTLRRNYVLILSYMTR